jgi:hypothetical protein
MTPSSDRACPQELPPRRPHSETGRRPHFHFCACGSYFTCHQDVDHCALPDPYVCPNCEQAIRDAWMTRHEGRR